VGASGGLGFPQTPLPVGLALSFLLRPSLEISVTTGLYAQKCRQPQSYPSRLISIERILGQLTVAGLRDMLPRGGGGGTAKLLNDD
jgi:hypothetical protein